MMIKNILCLGVLLGFLSVSAQTVNYNGLGRAYVTDDHFHGNLIENDTTSPSSGTGGYFIFDLGLNISPSEALKAQTIMRSKMVFGGFFGDGANFEFRQFKISGVLGQNKKGIKYEMGDLDLQLSPFTLYNFEESFNAYESDVFAQRRDIVHYENFNFGNAWRLQGVNLSTKLAFDKVIQSAYIQAFGTRTKNSTTFQTPDQFFIGARVGVVQSEMFTLKGNVVRFFNAGSTTSLPSNQFSNTVASTELNFQHGFGENKLKIDVETGMSNFSYSEVTTAQSVSLDDYFSLTKTAYEFTKLNLQLGASYRYVGFDFLSSGSQTRRIYDGGVPSVFGSVNENTAFRQPTVFDRYSQEAIYNQTLSSNLMSYNPRFNLVSPYGVATPNRQGVEVSVKSIDDKKWYEYDLAVQAISEIVGEGISNKRSFTSLQVGTKVKVNELLKQKKQLNLILGARSEQSKRNDALVDFSTLSLDIGVDWEFAKHAFLQGAFKGVVSSGQEYIGVRNQFNEITDYAVYGSADQNANITENVISVGTKYEFGKYSVFSFSVHLLNLANEDQQAVDYSIREYFIGYTLKF